MSRGPITAELRGWLKNCCSPYNVDERGTRTEPTWKGVCDSCDAIDAVHAGLERENAELRARVAELDESADSMHDGWVRLPLDADGVPFHIGELVDEMLPFGGYAAPAPIDTMELYRGASGYGWMVKLDAENRASISPSLLRHHAPTVEDVLREFVSEFNRDDTELCDEEIIERFAAKLRMAGDDAE